MAVVTTTKLSILSIFFILTFIPISSSSCPLHQKQSLLRFKSTLTTIVNSNSDPTSIDYIPFAELDSWNHGSDCCSWARVKCGRTRNVTELHLNSTVPWFLNPVPANVLTPLFEIRSLKVFDISMNLLQGEIPGDGFGNFTGLVHLDLYRNNFNGSIPDQIFRLPNLHYLDLSYNRLEGELPKEIGNLTRLRFLWLASNKFSGGIPSSIVHLNELRSLDLWGNSFSMQIPAGIGKLSNIKTLDLGYNRLKGLIPSSMRNMTKLESLWLQGNTLAGEIPTWLFEIKTLKGLSIGGKGNNLIWNNKAKIVPRCRLQGIFMTRDLYDVLQNFRPYS